MQRLHKLRFCLYKVNLSTLNEIQVQIDFDGKQDLIKKFELFFDHVNEIQTLNNMSVELANYFVKHSKYRDEL